MKRIKEFLESHPLISYNGIGVALGLRDGQLRSDRAIPKKFIVEVEKLLMGYGYLPGVDSVNEMVTGDYEVKTKMGVRMTSVDNVPETFESMLKDVPLIPPTAPYVATHVCRNGLLGVMDGGLFKRVLLDDGDYFVKKV